MSAGAEVRVAHHLKNERPRVLNTPTARGASVRRAADPVPDALRLLKVKAHELNRRREPPPGEQACNLENRRHAARVVVGARSRRHGIEMRADEKAWARGLRTRQRGNDVAVLGASEAKRRPFDG